jgi:hypothetical protein
MQEDFSEPCQNVENSGRAACRLMDCLYCPVSGQHALCNSSGQKKRARRRVLGREG